MQTRLVLIRHGETDDNVAERIAGWRESILTDRGRIQAEFVAAFVAERYRPTAIYASPLRRAWETAESLARRLELRVRPEPNLRELFFGDAEGLTVNELKGRFPEIWARAINDEDDAIRWPNGETRRGFYRRARQAIDAIASEHLGATVAVVTHGGVVSRFLADIAEGRPTRWNAYRTANGSVTEVVVANGSYSIADWNITEHLTLQDGSSLDTNSGRHGRGDGERRLPGGTV